MSPSCWAPTPAGLLLCMHPSRDTPSGGPLARPESLWRRPPYSATRTALGSPVTAWRLLTCSLARVTPSCASANADRCVFAHPLPPRSVNLSSLGLWLSLAGWLAGWELLQGGVVVPVFQTEVIKKTLSPQWKPWEVDATVA